MVFLMDNRIDCDICHHRHRLSEDHIFDDGGLEPDAPSVSRRPSSHRVALPCQACKAKDAEIEALRLSNTVIQNELSKTRSLTKPVFDKKAWQREYMRKVRARSTP